MGYAYMALKKVKSINQLSGCMKHTLRLMHVINADSGSSSFNDEIIKMTDQNFVAAYRTRIAASEYYKNRAVRKDAVKAIEVMMTYSRDDIDKIKIGEWKEANRKWLINTFGEDNVVSAVYHGDESTPHIHAIVIPMVKGHLNCKFYMGGKTKLRILQSSYADAMKPFGLKRGLENSKASHKEIQKFYAEFNRENNKELPPVTYTNGQPESAEEYRMRANQVYNKANITNLRELNRMQRRVNEAETLAANNRKDSAITVDSLKKENNNLKNRTKLYEDELSDYRQLSDQFGSVEDMKKQMQTLRYLEEGKEEYKLAYPNKAHMIDEMDDSIFEVLRWKRGRERENNRNNPIKDI